MTTQDPIIQFRSAATGQWYSTLSEPGPTDAVKVRGEIIERHEGERSFDWIRRAGEWVASKLET